MEPAPEPRRYEFILAGARTPFTKAGTDLRTVTAHERMRAALREAMERSGIRP